jgi:putative Ca2+/H+ antiporter (TMEM165/GDT1 family)
MMSDNGACSDHADSSCLANKEMTVRISESTDVVNEEAESSCPSQRSEQPPSHGRPPLLGAMVAALFILAAVCYVDTLSAVTVVSRTMRGHEAMASNRHLEDGANDDAVDDYVDDNGDEADDNDEQQQHQNGQDDDAPIYVDDDFVDDYYAFQQDPGPRRLLPITATDVFGFLLASMGVTLAAGGGIGGGGIVVPIYIIVMQFPPREAIPLAVVTVVGGALGTTIVNSTRRHPMADRPLIDWGLMIVMEPLVLVGTLFGTLLHRVVSEKVILVMLVVFYIVTARTMLVKARHMHESEKNYLGELQTARTFEEQVRRETIALEPAVGGTDNVSSFMTPQPLKEARAKIKFLLENEDFSSLRSDLLEQEKVTPREKILALCGMFSVLIFLNIMVGGGAFESPWGIQ